MVQLKYLTRHDESHLEPEYSEPYLQPETFHSDAGSESVNLQNFGPSLARILK